VCCSVLRCVAMCCSVLQCVAVCYRQYFLTCAVSVLYTMCSMCCTMSQSIHTYVHTYIHTYIQTYTHTCIQVYIHKYTYTNTHTCIHIYIHTHILINILTYIHTYTYTYNPRPPLRKRDLKKLRSSLNVVQNRWVHNMHAHEYWRKTLRLAQKRSVLLSLATGWWSLIGSTKSQIIFHKRATKYRSLLRKMTYKD